MLVQATPVVAETVSSLITAANTARMIRDSAEPELSLALVDQLNFAGGKIGLLAEELMRIGSVNLEVTSAALETSGLPNTPQTFMSFADELTTLFSDWAAMLRARLHELPCQDVIDITLVTKGEVSFYQAQPIRHLAGATMTEIRGSSELAALIGALENVGAVAG